MNQLVAELTKINQQTKAAIRTEVLAQVEANSGELQIINDPGSFNTLLKIYQRFINDADLRGLPQFLIEVDSLLHDFGGKPKPAQPEVDDNEEGAGESDEGSRFKAQVPKPAAKPTKSADKPPAKAKPEKAAKPAQE